MQTSWGALWPPLHPVHGGEGFDGESELSDGTFLKRKREDSKEKTRARGNPYAKSAVSDRTRECRKRRCVTCQQPPRSDFANLLLMNAPKTHARISEPLTVVNRGLGEYLGTRERGGGSMDARWTRCAAHEDTKKSESEDPFLFRSPSRATPPLLTPPPCLRCESHLRQARDALATRAPYTIQVRIRLKPPG